MKTLLKTIFLTLIFIALSCESENEQFNNMIITKNSDNSFNRINSQEFPVDIQVINERLTFNNKRDFIAALEYLINNNFTNQELNDLFTNFYSNGFIPLYPNYDESNEMEISNSLQRRLDYTPSEKVDSDNIELTDDLVPIDEFASFLNYKREFVINDKLYVYTYSGLFIADLDREQRLYEIFENNSVYDIAPNPFDLNPGINSVDDGVDVYVTPNLTIVQPDGGCGLDLDPIMDDNNPNGGNTLTENINSMFCNTNPSSGGTGSGSVQTDFTQELINYSAQLENCDAIDVYTPFGAIKKCFDYFDGGKRRTKTKYENIDLGIPIIGDILQSITVKVKHQREHSVWFVTWWASKKVDEVALTINEATFIITPPSLGVPFDNFNYPTNSGTNDMIYYVGNNAYNHDPSSIVTLPTPLPNLAPITPFNEDVIIQIYNDNLPTLPLGIDLSTTAENVNDFFWQQIYDQAKNVFQQISGYEPTKFTTIMTTQDQVIVSYIDVTRRQLNTKKIVDNLFFDVSLNFKVTISVDEWNNLITNPEMLDSDVEDQQEFDIFDYGIEKSSMSEFDYIKINFDGLTRRGSEWRGSRLSYEKN
ncbi:MAG: hypothetical protein GVY05_04500 [Bacteroidetes bacterium]|jgi:hypothetical protein|nr:hypothetical protein [Bacteroidota bacterium]